MLIWPPFLAIFTIQGLIAAPQEPIILYHTGFEPLEGYPPAVAATQLRGVQGWTGSGSGGNGLVLGYFEGLGQHAYIGHQPPAPKDGYLVLFRPVETPTPGPDIPVWSFSVWMMIVDSTNGQYDEFRWTAWNKNNEELFSLGFDNYTLEIYVGLDDTTGFYNTGFYFENGVPYKVEILMNFARNLWQARINGLVVVDCQPITTQAKELTLSDISAVWITRNPRAPGDNFMVFDEYDLRIEPLDTIPPVLETLGFNEEGQFELLLHGEPQLEYQIEISDDLQKWRQLESKKLDAGWWIITDLGSSGAAKRFYRAAIIGAR